MPLKSFIQCTLCRLCWLTKTSCSASNLESTEVHTEGKKPNPCTNLRFLMPHRNPLGCAIATTALDILIDERLSERAEILGEKFRSGIRAFNSPLVKEVRGRGLLNAVVIDESKSKRGRTAWQFCLLLKSKGVLAKPTHVNMYDFMRPPLSETLFTPFLSRIRFAPPLVIEEADLQKSIQVIGEALKDLDLVSIRSARLSTTLSSWLLVG